MRLVILIIFSLFLNSCETLMGKKNKEPLTGERHRVLLVSEEIKPDPEARHIHVTLPQAIPHSAWPMAGGNARHSMLPGLLNPNVSKVWETSVGTGNGEGLGFLRGTSYRLMNGPVVGQGKVFTVDAEGTVTATDLKTGLEVWRTESISAQERSQLFGGGVAYEQGSVYVSNANAEVLSLKAENGQILWRSKASGPVRAAPTVKDGRIFVVTLNNQLETFEAEKGTLLWTHTGIMENAGLLGGASPAVHEGVVVVAYSSGEVFALRAENGYVLWSESLTSFRNLDSASSLAYIKARPIIDRNLVFLVGNSGRMSALDLRTGQPVWTKNIGSIRTPALAGEFLFMVTHENNLLCLKRETGQVVWVVTLPSFTGDKQQEAPLFWTGPLLVNNQVVLANSQGRALMVMSDTGKKSLEIELPGSTGLSPIIADKTLLFLTDSATLVAYR